MYKGDVAITIETAWKEMLSIASKARPGSWPCIARHSHSSSPGRVGSQPARRLSAFVLKHILICELMVQFSPRLLDSGSGCGYHSAVYKHVGVVCVSERSSPDSKGKRKSGTKAGRRNGN